MKKNSLAVTAVAVIAVAIVTYKQWIQMPPAAFGTPKVTAKNGTGLSLLLIAEPRQASELDGCGVIVHMVRAAAARVSQCARSPRMPSQTSSPAIT